MGKRGRKSTERTATSLTRRTPLSGALRPTVFPSEQRQSARLAERRTASATIARIHGLEFVVDTGVYQTSIDTELMAAAVEADLKPSERFLEVGCGCGAVSLLAARVCRGGFGVDINPGAVANSIENARRLGIRNVAFAESDVFAEVSGRFDVIICNPPYNLKHAADPVERMFWDPDNEMKRTFFSEVRSHLVAGGRIFFGWADFPELDVDLPERLARRHGLRVVGWTDRGTKSGQRFFVLKIVPGGN